MRALKSAHVDYGANRFLLCPRTHSRMCIEFHLSSHLISISTSFIWYYYLNSLVGWCVVDKITLRYEAMRQTMQPKRSHTQNMSTSTWYVKKQSCKLKIIDLPWVPYGIFSIYTAIIHMFTNANGSGWDCAVRSRTTKIALATNDHCTMHVCSMHICTTTTDVQKKKRARDSYEYGSSLCAQIHTLYLW